MAIHVVAGNPMVSFLNHLSPGNIPITNETFTVINAFGPDLQSIPAVVEEVGNGTYRILADTDRDWIPGTYYILVEASSGDRYDETFELTRYEQPTVVTQAMQGTGSSRQEIRRAVAAELGDLVLAKATRDGEYDTIFDEVHLARETRHFDGMQLLCTKGAPENVGKTATVSASNGQYRSVTFTPAFPEKVFTGDEFEMVNRRGMGWSFDQYNRAINVAIQRAGEEHAVIPYSEDIPDPVSVREPEITIPDTFEYFSGITIIDRYGRSRKIPPKDYEVDRHSRTVLLKGRSRRRFASPQSVKMHGYVRPGPLLEDHHKTTVQLEWLIVEVKAELESYDVTTGMNQGVRDRLYNMDRTGADARRITVIGTRAPNTIRLS